MKPNENDAAPVIGCLIATAGEVFTDGAMIDLIGGVHPAHPELMLWDGSTEVIGPGCISWPAVCTRTDREQHPTGIDAPYAEQPAPNDVVTTFGGLDEKSASRVARIVLCSAIVEAVSVAPVLVIAGPDTAPGNRLVSVLRCLCRHSVPLASVTPASLCSLANGARYTFLISQANISDKLRSLLDDASRSDRKIPFRGRLLDLFGVQVVQSESVFADDPWPLR
ncbi:MAG: hypothetical protein WB723_18550 [Candidatus Acidiferrales bacterium]